MKVEMKYEDGHEDLNESTVLEGLKVLDVGCGGGLLSEVSPIHVVLFGRMLTLMPVEPCSAWCKHLGLMLRNRTSLSHLYMHLMIPHSCSRQVRSHNISGLPSIIREREN